MPQCPFCEKTVAVNTDTCPHCRAPLSGLQPKASDDLEQRVRSLLDQNQKIAAIKLYREATGVGLAEAKSAVEAMQSGGALHIPEKNISESFEGDVLRLLGDGKKIQAIKLYRQHIGGGLKEAKEAVDALGEKNGIIVRGSGCLGVVLVVIVGTLLTWAIACSP